jgi:NAD(P)-dependent dehydrogenase (short-subunit alcohol dehydrogenase family)
MPEHRQATPRTVLVTGAGGGLGRAFALGFAVDGYRVVAADIDEPSAVATVALLQDAGAEALAVGVDVTDRASTDSLAAATADFGGGRIDVLLNNAAIYATIERSAFEDIADDEWDRVLGVNLKGVWQMTRAASPYLASGSAVINLASATVLSGSAHWAHYVASKAGVIGLTRVLARELGVRDITVNAIAPGFTLTDASRGLLPDAETYGVERGSIKRAIEPQDVVGAALFLAGGGSGFVTGQTLVVDGGRQFL